MTVESATFISELNASLPAGTDAKSEGDNHLRLEKDVLQKSLRSHSTAVGLVPLSATGTANALVITPSPAITSLTTFMRFAVAATAANTGACTLQVGSAAAVNLMDINAVALQSGAIANGMILDVVYDGTQFRVLGQLKAVTMGGVITMSGKSLWTAEGADVASASSCNIWATDGNFRHITGTATINDFATAPQAGAVMGCIADAAFTVADSATIVVPGNANWVVEAGDTFEVYAETTTTFRIINIQKSSVGSGASVKKATGQSVTNSTPTILVFDAEDFDDYAWHDNVTNNSRITVTAAGRYNVNAIVAFDSMNNGVTLTLELLVNGGTGFETASNDNIVGRNYVTMNYYLALVAGDYLELRITHTDSAARTTNALFTKFQVMRIK